MVNSVAPNHWFRCPGCKGMGLIDDDQYYGRVSIDCTNCESHEKIAVSKMEHE